MALNRRVRGNILSRIHERKTIRTYRSGPSLNGRFAAKRNSIPLIRRTETIIALFRSPFDDQSRIMFSLSSEMLEEITCFGFVMVSLQFDVK